MVGPGQTLLEPTGMLQLMKLLFQKSSNLEEIKVPDMPS